jgi:hypothetical protein
MAENEGLVGSRKSGVGSWKWAVASYQSPVGSRQFEVGSQFWHLLHSSSIYFRAPKQSFLFLIEFQYYTYQKLNL